MNRCLKDRDFLKSLLIAFCIYWLLYLCACCLCYNCFQNPCKDADRLTIKCDNTAPKSTCRIQVKSSRHSISSYWIFWYFWLRYWDNLHCAIYTSAVTSFHYVPRALLLMWLFLLFLFFFSAILPNMISRRTGQIVLINSIQGKIGIPFRAACKLHWAKMCILMHKMWIFHVTDNLVERFSKKWNSRRSS